MDRIDEITLVHSEIQQILDKHGFEGYLFISDHESNTGSFSGKVSDVKFTATKMYESIMNMTKAAMSDKLPESHSNILNSLTIALGAVKIRLEDVSHPVEHSKGKFELRSMDDIPKEG